MWTVRKKVSEITYAISAIVGDILVLKRVSVSLLTYTYITVRLIFAIRRINVI